MGMRRRRVAEWVRGRIPTSRWSGGAPSRRTAIGLSAFLGAVALLAAACGTGSSAPARSGPGTTTAGVTSGSTVYRWGVVGNKGAISQLQLDRPTPVVGVHGHVVQVATSNSDGYALTSAGTVYGWGVNSYGELGEGKLTPYDTAAVRVDFPAGVRIATLANPMPFDAGLAIDTSGRAWGWGLNGDGDLCLPGLVEAKPAPIPLPDVTLASGARTHALFVSQGTVSACGSGDAGELGNGSLASSRTPVAVTGLPVGAEVTALTSSWEGSGALLADGDYYNWGYNAAGQLGNGSTDDSARPVKVALPGPVREAFQGGSGAKNGQTVVILRNGQVWTWGDNDRGQLGIGSRTSSLVPTAVHVPDGVTFVTVSSGGYASYAVDSKGRLWAWGDNRSGQLGTGADRTESTLPVDVGLRITRISSTAQNVAGS